ncbi:MAG: 4Fe-4S dicluster domain-containing protein [Gammaproteobacteria bacterium]|uniref:4Fe-4S dicluster domain-containing protein n=1 Tax=Pseudomaricurvus alcaniphilus TaxID=1166482 RepID=UPI00140DB99F|nr:4Fe-4S binding protein [Pseudomaricurvus alcaniphilus]MBR9912004.1 4Fe-4S dicluster domain-containing protein [Gammaproteobacteria bacterium]NHN39849.1 4Fe-4S binding protein [Pseudomaricurvus alcaniphilus]
MAYVITAACVADSSCVDICPVDCIGPRPDDPAYDDTEQLYIDPAACIDCAACVDVCPVLAIYEAGALPLKWQHYAAINRQYFRESES